MIDDRHSVIPPEEVSRQHHMHSKHELSSMDKRDLLALSRAIDDEMLARDLREGQYDCYC